MKNRLRELRESKHLYQKDMAKLLNIAVSTYSYWEKGTYEPDQEALSKLANHFGVSVDYLIGHSNQNEPFPEEERRDALIKQIGGFEVNFDSVIPVFERVVAGVPIEAQTDIVGYIPTMRKPAKDYFAIRVSGKSMQDCGITDGSTIVVHKQSNADNRDIVVAIIDNAETTVKRFIRRGDQIFLMPENKDFDPIFVTPEMNLEILGVVVDVITHLK